jgi:uncharacterized SAM-binding protein YcdF (DUF218 family)
VPERETAFVRSRRVLGLSLAALAIAQAAVVAFVHPPFDTSPGKADAVFVMAGDHGDRLDTALRLMNEGVAPTLVILRPSDSPNIKAPPLCAGRARFEVVCVDPLPVSTLGDGRAIDKLTRQRHWRHVVVVTSRFHALRAGWIARRCADVSVAVVPSRPPFGVGQWLKAIVRESLGLAQIAVLHRGC